MKKKTILILSFIVSISIAVYSYNYWSSYQEKSMVEAVDVEEEKIDAIYFFPSENSDVSGAVKDEASIREFLSFLEGYQVKKLKKRGHTWEDDRLFLSIITEDGSRSIKAEQDIFRTNQAHYQVLNRPIDMEWVREFKSAQID